MNRQARSDTPPARPPSLAPGCQERASWQPRASQATASTAAEPAAERPSRASEGPPSERGCRLVRTLASLGDPALRLDWLSAELAAGSLDSWAPALEQLLAEPAESPSARQARLALALWVAGRASEPQLQQLRELSVLHGHRRLQLILPPAPQPTRRSRWPSEAPTSSVAPARSTRPPLLGPGGAQRLPPLGQRRAWARRSPRQGLAALLRDPHPRVITELLLNPLLTEADVCRVVATRPGNPQVLRAVAQSNWLTRPRVRLALLLNPNTPLPIGAPLIAVCTRCELGQVRAAADVDAELRRLAEAAERALQTGSGP